jgi:hypothetical protein
MGIETESEAVQLLREIRDGQREALAMQRDYVAAYQRQLERTEQLQNRAETIQKRAGGAIKAIVWLAIPLLLLLIVLLLWPHLVPRY